MHSGVEAFLDKSSLDLAKVMMLVRKVILSCSPNIEEKISYGVPYYCCMGPMCYFHITKQNTLQLGFARGNLLEDPFGVLEKKDRSIVKSIEYTDCKEVNQEHIRFFIQESIQINSEKGNR